jgi:radical SAM protein with 4Fe4S-binding SPASM domain
MVYLAERLGVRNMHLLLSHRRGRAAESESMASPPDQILLQAFLEVRRLTYASGIAFDNIDTLEGKLLGRPGVKFDLTNMAYTSLCVYADGQVYPSAALAGIPSLEMGSLMERPLSDIWNAPIADTIRRGTVQRKARCKDCYLKYLCGGGDPEQTYHNSGHFMGEDPFSQFHEALILETLFSVIEARAKRKTASGFDRPIVFAAMGDMAIEDTDGHGVSLRGGFEVSLSRSACVLSVDLDKSRRYVRDFYGGAAKSPKPQLCCVGGYSPQETSHIPKSVMEIAYGCGSPIAMAGIQKGEVVVDLGAEAYLAQLERAGFYGLSVIKKDFWKEVEGYRFYSIILRGYKFEKKAGCSYIGQQAIYLGPMQGVVDEEGHFFPRNRAIDVCTDTAEKLTHPPYSGSFVIVEGEKKSFEMKTPVVSTEEACCPPGKCC